MLTANILQPLIDVANAVLVFFHDDLGASWGMSIILLTFATRALLIPLTYKQIKSMRALQAFQPQMKELGHGSIIDFSSISWRFGADQMIAYATAKGAVVALTNALARAFGGVQGVELAPVGGQQHGDDECNQHGKHQHDGAELD